MATIANLAVSVTARIGKFRKNLASATKRAQRFGRDVSRHIKRAGAAFGLLAASAAVGLGALVQSQLKAIDSTAKMSRVLGFSTEELTGYQHAIALAGGNSEQFNKAILRMNRTIADAEAGLSTAIREIERAGLSVEDFAGLSTDQRIKLLAERYDGIGDAAGRASFLMNVFGRAGASVGNLFEQGADGIARAQKEAEKLGLTFSAIDARQVEAANDAFTRFRNLIVGVGRTLAIRVAPFIQELSDRLVAMGTEGEGAAGLVSRAIEHVIRAIAKLADMFHLLRAAWFGFQSIVLAGAALILNFMNSLAKGTFEVLNFITGRNVRYEDTFLFQITEDFNKAQERATQNASNAWDKFTSGENSKKVDEFFTAAEKRSRDFAKTAARSFDDSIPDDFGVSDQKTAQFKQVDLSRVFIGGLQAMTAKTQETSDETTHDILREISGKVGKGTAAVTV